MKKKIINEKGKRKFGVKSWWSKNGKDDKKRVLELMVCLGKNGIVSYTSNMNPPSPKCDFGLCEICT